MATTTNYGWTTPDDTALVKDGAAAIRTLGSSVDTTTKALNPSTTLGDIEYRSSTANTNTRLAIGSTGNILTVAGGVPTWAAPAGGGGMTSLASGSLAASATGFDLTSISGAYNELWLYVAELSVNVAGTGYNNTIYLNNDTGDNYSATGTRDGAVVNENSIAGIRVMSCEQNTGTFSMLLRFPNYANATSKKLFSALGNSHATTIPKSTNGMWSDNSAITRITLTLPVGAYDAGTYILYGVK